ncbi:MAG: hypothetical protein CL440_06855 [Acidimicrobiaceae bacterium]|nr:hypothetical protein [Acidimicrobiaceae bacterium]|tara:strand:- start:6452 stop:6937 length:486 start_codon:yes stop_codon:yes gene_type:complete
MPFDDEDEISQMSGGALRQKLEQTLEENKLLASELSGLKAHEVISEHGLSLVEPTDLKGVDISQLEQRAREIQEDRRAQQEKLARDLLAKRGYEGEELESQLQDFLGSEPVAPTHADAEAITRAQQVGAVSGQPTSIINPETLSGVAAIEYALEQKENKRK